MDIVASCRQLAVLQRSLRASGAGRPRSNPQQTALAASTAATGRLNVPGETGVQQEPPICRTRRAAVSSPCIAKSASPGQTSPTESEVQMSWGRSVRDDFSAAAPSQPAPGAVRPPHQRHQISAAFKMLHPLYGREID